MLILTSCPCQASQSFAGGALKARLGKPSIILIIACYSPLPSILTVITLSHRNSIEGKAQVEVEVEVVEAVEAVEDRVRHPIPL